MAMTKTIVDVAAGTTLVRDLTPVELIEQADLAVAMEAEDAANAARHADLDNQSKMLRAIVEYFRIEAGVSSEDARAGIRDIYNGM